MKFLGRGLGILVASALCAGCGTKPMKGAFEELTYEGSSAKTAVAKYNSLLSISGLIPAHTPGAYFLEAGSTSSPTLLSGISSDCSYVVRTKFADGDMNTVMQIRDAYLDLRESSLAVAVGLTQLSRARKQAASLKSEPSSGTLLPEAHAAADIRQKEAEAEKTLANARASLATASAKVRKAMAPNYLVTTWASDEHKSVSAGLDEQSVSASVQRQRKGLLVMGGLRVRALVLGKDYKQMLTSLQNEDGVFLTSAQMANVGIVTLVIEARHVAYISERDVLQDIAATLGFTKAQLIAMLDDETKIQIAAAMSAAEAVSNAAAFSAPEITYEIFSFTENDHEESVHNELEKSSGYVQTYVVRGNLNFAGITLLGKNNENPLDCKEKASRPRMTAPPRAADAALPGLAAR